MNTLLDEPSDMEVQHHLLRDYGLVEATSAEQAIQRLHDGSRKTDLLLTAVTLAADSEIQVALTIRSEKPCLPVIDTSSYQGLLACTTLLSRNGRDVILSDPFERAAPSPKSVTRRVRVSDSGVLQGAVLTAFGVSQALSRVAGQRNDMIEGMNWEGEIPGLMRRLLAAQAR